MVQQLSHEEAQYRALMLRAVLLRRRRGDVSAYLATLASSFPEQAAHARVFYGATHLMPWDISIDSLAPSSQVENLREMYYVHPSLTRPTLEDVAPETYAFLTACELLAEMEQIDYQLKQLHTSSS